jgi:hypothetical protein
VRVVVQSFPVWLQWSRGVEWVKEEEDKSSRDVQATTVVAVKERSPPLLCRFTLFAPR